MADGGLDGGVGTDCVQIVRDGVMSHEDLESLPQVSEQMREELDARASLNNTRYSDEENAWERYQRESLKTALVVKTDHPVIYPTLGLANEAGEVAGKIKKIF